MSNETPFTAHGDEPVEARIVSWVLGEASAFEVAELERLCEERPELMVFKRRMAALHGLITEAEKPRFNHAWKLPAGKRRPLDEIIGEEPPVRVDFEKEKRIRHSGRRAFLAIAACLVLTVVVAGLMAPMALKQSRKSDVAEARSMARQREMAAMEDQERGGVAYQAMESLSTVLPPERIEGTPKPMVLPSQTPSKEKAQLSAPADRAPGGDAQVDRMVQAKKVPTDPDRKPSAPSSSMAKAITAATTSATAIPTPDIDLTAPTPSLDFGDGGDFGTGWGGAGDGSGGGQANAPAAESVRSTDAPIVPGSASVLADAREGGLKKDLAALEENKKRATGFWTADESAKAEIRGKNLPANRGMIVDRQEVTEEASGGRGPTPSATPAAGPAPENPVGSESYSGLAQREMARRQNTVFEGDRLLAEGRDAYKKGDYQQAADEYQKALEKIPDSPMFADRLQSYQQHLSDAKVAQAMQDRKVGKHDEARKGLEEALKANPSNEDVKREIAYLEDPLRTNPALTYEHTQNVDQVRRNLYSAEGNYNLGKYDDAKREYEKALQVDPYNSAARRGLERVEATKSDYYRAAYDHTRSELLAQVDSSWELAVPAESGAKDNFDGFVNYGSPILGSFKFSNFDSSELDLYESKGADGDKVPLLGDIPLAGAVFKAESKPGEIEYEIHTGYTSEYLFRGVDLGEVDKEVAVPADKVEIQKTVKSKKKAKPEPPKVDLTKLMEEIAASEDPYSTFSLNISDASFQIAQAALAKGERPDPAGIKVEQFYNAVNYGDPAPAANQPVSCVIEQAAHPVIPGRNLVRVALKTAAAGRSAAQPLRLTLLVDQSGSMVRADRREAMDAAMRSLGTLLTDKDLVTVIGFSRTSRLLAVDMKGSEVGEKLAGLVNQAASEGGTNLEDAIKLAEEKAMRQKLVGAQNRIVLFTDGAANLGDADPQRLASKVEQLRQQGIAFDIAGIAADDLNDELLAELARKGNGRYSVVGKGGDENFAKQLAGAFRPAAENVKVQVRFNPERVARYKLIGFEKDRLKTEDFRNDAVDAAELAAEEAGVAIYQVEPLPEGRGEIGEVSVRFRDTASGEMVERMWTMAHNSATTGVDRATPSMQLAVLSMLAGEKLKGGPLADAIDFKNFSQAQATVKQAYGQDTRVSEMLRMVNALK